MASQKNTEQSLPWAALMVLVLGAFMAILDSSIVNVALPRMMTIFGASADDIQWVLTGYLLTSGVVVPVTGFLGDRFGNKKMYIYSLAAFTAGSALCGMAWSTNSLIVARVLQAIGGGAMMPISMAMLYNIVPRDKIGMALGIWGIAATAAPAIGPTLGGYLVDSFSWRWIFTINIPVGIVAVFLSVAILTETERRPGLKFDLMGCILCMTGCFAVLLALSEGQSEGWTSQYIVTLLVISFFALVLFILWELHTPEPMLDVRLFKNFVFTVSLIATSVATVGLFAGVFLIPIFAQNIQGYTPMQTGLMMMPMAIVTGIMMPISGKLFDKYGALPLGVVGLGIVAVTTYHLHVINLNTTFHYIQVLMAVRAVGLGLTMMPLTTAGMNTIPRFLVGRASALNNLVRQLAASLGIAFLTYIMLNRQAEHYAWYADGVSLSSPAAVQTVNSLQGLLTGYTGSPEAAGSGALTVLYGTAQRQAYVAGVTDTFIVAAVFIGVSIPLMYFLSKKRVEAARQAEEKRYAHLMPGGGPGKR